MITISNVRPLLAALLLAAAGLMASAPPGAAAESLAEAATNICVARGETPDTPEFEACYQQVLVELTVMLADGISE